MIGAETTSSRPEWQRQDFGAEGMPRPPEQDLEPLLEGARARGMVDAFEMVGQAAMLIDAEGRVLHVNGPAVSFMGATIAVSERRLVGGAQGATELLQTALSRAIGGESAEILFDRSEQEGRVAVALKVRAMPVPRSAGNAAQLVKAIVLLDVEEARGRDGIEWRADDRDSASPWRGAGLAPLF